MLRKFFMIAILSSITLSLCSCEFLRHHTPQDIMSGNWDKNKVHTAKPIMQYESNVPLTKQPSSVVVCRSHQCAPAKLSMSREYIFNSLLQLFDNNNYQKVLLCQADSGTRTCIENQITLPTKVGVVPTNAYIDYTKITDVVVGKQGNSLNIILNYNLTYGGQTADCTPARSLLFARNIDHVILEDTGYNCKMTTIGTTNVKTIFAIDYIDLDYGYIGGYYSIGLSGPAYGGGNGYMILRLPKNAYPLSPALKAPKRLSQTLQSTGFAPAAPSQETQTGNYANGVQVFPIEKK